MKKYNEPNGLNDVAEFHNTFDLPIKEKPLIPNAKRCELRVNLLQEELNELKEAIEQNDLVEIADALADLQYVLSGAVLEFGLGSKFETLFSEVHRSNMSKTCATKEIAEQTVEHYKKNKSMNGYIQQKGTQFLVYRKEDNKVLKSVAYSKADLKSIVEK